LLSLIGAIVGCQSSAPQEPSTSERTTVVVKYSVKLEEPFKVADSLSWTTGTDEGGGVRPVSGSVVSGSRSYSASLSLGNPLGGNTLVLSLWSHGFRIVRLSYSAKGATDELTLIDGSAILDGESITLLEALVAKKDSIPQSREGAVGLYGSWVLSGDVRAMGFPDNLPVGMSPTEIVQAALVAASKVALPLAKQAENWQLGISGDSARTLVLSLIRNGKIDRKDSIALFPPAPIRVKTALTVAGSPKAGGDPVGLAGAFEWNDGLGLVALRSVVLHGKDTVATVAASSLPVPAIEDRSASLSSASIVAFTPAVPGEYTLVVVAADGKGNQSVSTTNFVVGAKEPDQPTAPKVRLASPSNNAVVPFSSTEIVLQWIVSSPPGAVIDTVLLDGIRLEIAHDSVWSGTVNLEPTGKAQTVVLRARNSAGLWTTEVAQFTRRQDETGPEISWISPSGDGVYENSQTSILVRVKVVDPSGVDTVLIAGQKPDSLNAAGEWVRMVPLTVVGSPMTISVRAVDHAKNASVSNLAVTRQNPSTDIPPKTVLVAPASKTGTVVIFDSAYAMVRWTITDPYGVDSTSVAVNGVAAISEPGNNWSARIALAATGAPTSIALTVKNKNGVSGGDVISITRQSDTVHPVLDVVAGSRAIGYDSAKALVSWKVSDNDKIARVTIQGVEIDSANGVYASNVALDVGDNSVKISATDRAGNVTSSTVMVHRYQKLAIDRVSPKLDTIVSFSATTVPVVWNVTGAKSVWVGDNPASCSNGRCTYQASLATNGTRVFFWATDSANMMDSSVVTITRRNQAALALSYGKDTLSTLPDSVVIAASSEVGASLAWSLDGTSWTNFTGSVVQKVSGTVLVRAQVAGKDDKIASLKAFTLYHVNRAPLISAPASVSASALGFGTATKLPFAHSVAPGPNDPAQTVAFSVSLRDAADAALFSVVPTLDGQNLSFSAQVLGADTVWLHLRAKDNGGTDHGGVDTASFDLKLMFTDTVIDARDGRVYHFRRIGTQSWMTENSRWTPPSGVRWMNGDSTQGQLYLDAHELHLGTTPLNVVDAPCPTGWRMSTFSNWQTLVQYASGPTGSISDGLARLFANNKSWWRYTWTATTSDTVFVNSTDAYGFHLRPNYFFGGGGPDGGESFPVFLIAFPNPWENAIQSSLRVSSASISENDGSSTRIDLPVRCIR
jgi:uncharacterized protein (TIGR02145 family)